MLLFSRLFLKVMPENDENGYGAFIRNRKLDVTEVEAYRTVLRDLVGFLFFASMFPSVRWQNHPETKSPKRPNHPL